MVKRTITKDYTGNLAIVTITGEMTANDVYSVNSEAYGDTQKALWDLRGADLSGFNAQELTSLADTEQGKDESRHLQAIAVLVKNDADKMIAKLYVELGKVVVHRELPHFVTSSEEEALQWLSEMVD